MDITTITSPTYAAVQAAIQAVYPPPRAMDNLRAPIRRGKMTAEQARTAWHLAHQRYHGWASHGEFTDDAVARGGDCEVLNRREQATSPDWPGISPIVGSDGSVWHRSCTDRTVWRVARDGSARIWLFDNAPCVRLGVDPGMVWAATIDLNADGLALMVAASPSLADSTARVQDAGLWQTTSAMTVTLIPPPPPPIPRPLDDGQPVRRL